ncbi:MAG: HRDC domain-containing protein [Planctomycetes bacterium]|nr:HRDC domain-containing protein [Planctomycetota bacterium]
MHVGQAAGTDGGVVSLHHKASLTIPQLVETSEALGALIDSLEGVRDVAIDIESNGYYNYFERTCIISLSTPDQDFVIDSLALWNEIEPLRVELCDKGRRILVHGGSYDVLSLKRDFGFRFDSIIDTMLAATLLGFDVLGLAGLVKKYLDIDLPKELQRHNWTLRPLQKEQLRYLGNDTRFLFPVVEILEAQIAEKDLQEELDLECEALAAQPYIERTYDPKESVDKLKDSRRMSPKVRGYLREIFRWRDEVSREIDVAPFRLLANNVVLALATHPPKSSEELRERRGVGKYVFDSGIERLAKAIQEGEANPFPFTRERGPRPSTKRNFDEERNLSKALKQWRTNEAEKRGIGIQGVLPTPAMKEVGDLLPQSDEELLAIDRVGKRRVERYGEDLIEMVAAFCPESLRQKAKLREVDAH